MKIGILTFHRAHNYGAVLQCYALQEVLKSMGHDVEVIDYRQTWIEYDYRTWTLRRFYVYRKSPMEFIHYVKNDAPRRIAKTAIFEDFRKHFLNLSRKSGIKIPRNYDAYIIGSDQLWGRNCLGGKLDPIYFGQFEHEDNALLIGYAISSNLPSLSQTDKGQLKKLLSNFTSLSVRESSVANYLYSTYTINPAVTLDPALLTNAETWDSLIEKKWEKRKYILVYYVQRWVCAGVHDVMLDAANELAAKYECEVVDLSTYTFAVADFVSAFKYAECVITSSFHATVFSIIFNRPIYAVKLNDGADARYVDLLSNLGMENNLVDLDFKAASIPSIDYDRVNDSLKSLRKSSFDFLAKSLTC